MFFVCSYAVVYRKNRDSISHSGQTIPREMRAHLIRKRRERDLTPPHRRRIDLEDKAKVVPYAWGAESLPR